jgi:hypothetical protein
MKNNSFNDYSAEHYWRSLILYGVNVATYKFALGKSLLELVQTKKDKISADELAIVFSKNVCEHVKSGKSQCTNKISAFIDSCRAYNNNIITQDQLISETKKAGFRYVLDAFHGLNGGQISKRFYDIDGTGKNRTLILTDNIFELAQLTQFENLNHEVEARWRLVEDAWTFGTGNINNPVLFDTETKGLYVEDVSTYRRDLTAARNAFIGYQKGKCFYCFDDILIGENINCDVDHFIPFTLRYRIKGNLNGVWNLVLACSNCNRGENGKFHSIPKQKFLERLNIRNNYLIASNHPLSNTIKNQTGQDDRSRASFLNEIYNFSLNQINKEWEPKNEFEFEF